ncbi:MAG: ABC transporter permease [bacterium]|nr:ABC transporter permease [bacterium]MCY4257022.1 ABC transporter permease [bacterium]
MNSARITNTAKSFSAPIVAGLVIFGVWQGALGLLDPDGFVLPAPIEIVAALVDNWDAVSQGARITGFVVVSGLGVGIVLGVLAALLVTRFRAANETITPLAVAINAVPIIALAPIFNNWFGLTSPRSNQAIVVALVFFPIFINTARGLTQVDRSQIELMESYAASRSRIAREVRIPNAMPYFFTALKLATSLAVIAAIVAEYFGGRQDALGPIITQSAGLTRYDTAWAAVLAGTAIGAVLYFGAVLLERLVMPWHLASRNGSHE